MDKVLPFGLSYAPKIFSAQADALQWILHHNGFKKGLHYLDDYVLVAKDLQSALLQKQTSVSMFEKLGVPMEVSKLEGPARCLVFLGIEFDTASMQLRLPIDKLEKLKRQLKWASFRRSIPKEELESLVGLLQFATCGMPHIPMTLRHRTTLLDLALEVQCPIGEKFHSNLCHHRRFASVGRLSLTKWSGWLPTSLSACSL